MSEKMKKKKRKGRIFSYLMVFFLVSSSLLFSITKEGIKLDKSYTNEILADEVTATLIIQKDGFLVFDGIGTIPNLDCRQMFLSGVEFTLYDSNEEIIESKTTVSGQQLKFTGLEKNTTYYLKETKGVDPYRASNIRYTINVTDELGRDPITDEETWIVKIPEYPNYGIVSGSTKTPLLVVNGQDPIVYKKINLIEDSLVVSKSDTYTFDSTVWLPGDVNYWGTFMYNKLEIIDIVDERLEVLDTPTLVWSYGALSSSDYNVTTAPLENGKTLVKAEITDFSNLKRTSGTRWDSYGTNLHLQYTAKVADDIIFNERIFSDTTVDFIDSGNNDGTVLSNRVYVRPDVETTSITANKIWVNSLGDKPTIELQLFQNENVFEDSILLENGVSEYTWDNLPKYDDNEILFEYSVQEINVPENYEASYSDDTFTITNTYIPIIEDKVTITVQKIWIDAPDIKPTIELQLLQNGNVFKDSILLENGVSEYTWDNLPKSNEYDIDYTYTVQEINIPENYEVSYSDDTFTITNIYIPVIDNKISVTGQKLWVNAPDIKPTIALQLLQDDKIIGEPVLLKNGTNEYTWKDLPKYKDNGIAYMYTIQEIDTPEYYKVTYSDNGHIVTNAYIEPKVIDPIADPPVSSDQPNHKDPYAPVETGDSNNNDILLIKFAISSLLIISYVRKFKLSLDIKSN